MEKFLNLKEHSTDVHYRSNCWFNNISLQCHTCVVNPSILSQAGMPAQGVFLATII